VDPLSFFASYPAAIDLHNQRTAWRGVTGLSRQAQEDTRDKCQAGL
jgi:hypothetical protein